MTDLRTVTTFKTPNPDRVAAFYERAFGFESYDPNGSGQGQTRHLRLGAHCLEFSVSRDADSSWQDRRVCDPGYTHIALSVSDFESALARAVDAGYRPGTPYRSPEISAVYGQDPEGNTIELNSRAAPAEGSTPGADPFVNGMTHVGISTPDIRAFVTYYVETLGFELTVDRMTTPNKGVAVSGKDPTYLLAFVQRGGFSFEVFEWIRPSPLARQGYTETGPGIVAVQLPCDDIGELCDVLQSRSVAIENRHELDLNDGQAVVWLRDCDGNRLGFSACPN